jgi:hypothetical protein
MADDVEAERHEEGDGASPPKAEIACRCCSLKRESPIAKSGKPRIPRGWKEIGSALYCQKCKGQKFAIRAVSIPIAACDWNVVMPILKSAWKDCVSFANWFSTQLYMSDSLSVRSDKLPSWKAPYLYNEARKRFPGIGHRVAHCDSETSQFQAHGYFLNEIGPITKEIVAQHKCRRGKSDTKPRL